MIPELTQRNPFAGKSLYVYPDSSAAAAAEATTGSNAAAFETIAQTPAAIWLVPEAHPTATVASFVSEVSATAAELNQVAVFVIYGIPNRDCENQSAGGLSEEDYPGWVSAIGTGLSGSDSVVILEPDALSLAGECGNVDLRVAQVKDAAARLIEADITMTAASKIYLDAGHSNWLEPSEMAVLLHRAGINQVQGFATNVSNFNPTDDERAYSEQLSSLTGGAHYVIDTSRNGNGSNGEWCNPSGRALGQTPGAIADGSRHDANLWIKNPGESDGQCNGGPRAGEWWSAGALALVNG
ncbi:MAG TPA: glycoside hydrolase family 6 protein [Glaciihabitans sp.]|nr:glycoside hydrolase family 6 protein [Glaciihabitans sp.]